MLPSLQIRHLKAPLLLCIFSCVVLHASSQTTTISGNVSDRTGKPLEYAHVYLNFTTIGSHTDERGFFILKGISSGEHEIVVSHVGYHSYNARITIVQDLPVTLAITLEQDIRVLGQLEVEAKKDVQWTKQYEKFKKMFLGTSTNAEATRIINPYGLSFTDGGGIFTAKASEILKIENFSLGYRIFYQLNNFLVGPKTYNITGFVRFEELPTYDSVLARKWERNRMETFLGSPRHLFKAIMNGSAESEGYKMFEDISGLDYIRRRENFEMNLGVELKPFRFTALDLDGGSADVCTLNFPLRLEVHRMSRRSLPKIYRDIARPVSWIEIRGGSLKVDSRGVAINYQAMTLSGAMGDLRVSDLLPYEFDPAISPAITPVSLQPPVALQYLVEKPYLHTDRNYYFGGDDIWIKAYMNYHSRPLIDSLSKVLYVEFINPSREIVSRKTVRINDGMAESMIKVPRTSSHGNYVLRAYTRWMLNFDASLIFTKSIRILSPEQMAEPVPYHIDKKPAAEEIVLTSDKETYGTHQIVAMNIEVLDVNGQLIPANLSMSVTDMAEAVPASNEKNIVSDFSIGSVQLPDTLSGKPEFPLQYGMEVTGRFTTRKGKAAQGRISFFQENSNDVFVITTDSTGFFYISNLNLYDTASITYVATVNGKRRPGKVTFDSVRINPEIRDVSPLELQVRTRKAENKFLAPPEVVFMDELLVETKREPQGPANNMNLPADFTLRGDDLEAYSGNDLLEVLRSRVPGFRLTIRTGSDGQVIYSMRLGSVSSFDSNQEPLVLVDGVSINGEEGDAVIFLQGMSARDVEAIEIIKYGKGAAFGARGTNGVILITTRSGNGNAERNEMPANSIPVKLPGFSIVPTFLSDSSAANREHRITVYWNASIKTSAQKGAQITFRTAGTPGNYRVVVEGITAAGAPVRYEKILTVQKDTGD